MTLSRNDMRVISRMMEQQKHPSIFFATVTGVDTVKRLVKVILEPYGIETTWCKAVKGFFPCDYKQECTNIGLVEKCKWSQEIEQGIEVLVAAIMTASGVQYIVLGELE